MKQIIKNYTFNKTARTVTFTDFATISLDRLLLITNVTSNTVVYQFNSAALGGSVIANVLTLACNTGGMSSSDKLQIIYDCAIGDPFYDLQVDSQGRLSVSPAPLVSSVDSVTALPGTVARATFSAAASFIPAASATDVFAIVGGSTKAIYVTRVIVSGIQTTAGNIECVLIKRSSANTGGTFVAANMIPHDSGNAAATALVGHYTANPTSGTSLGAVRRERLFVPASGSVTPHDHVVWDFETTGQPIVLKNASQLLTVNLLGATLAGGLLSVSAEWYEV
jgi:hypothetical protein